MIHAGSGGMHSISFTANHPQNHGNWSISVVKGATGLLSQAGGLPPATASASLLAGCPMAGFAAYLHVAARIQNG